MYVYMYVCMVTHQYQFHLSRKLDPKEEKKSADSASVSVDRAASGPCKVSELDRLLLSSNRFIKFIILRGMGKGCVKLGRLLPMDRLIRAYNYSLLLSPLVSVWDCIVRTMREAYKEKEIEQTGLKNMECAKVPQGVRKAKKKPVKDELDRIKQAEKKKRRLEKALANSAAIRSELEKKKQKKIEEQRRLDEEGAAIAEAVALNVLLGDDVDDTCKIVVNKDDDLNLFDSFSNFKFIGQMGLDRPYQNFPEHSIEGIGWVPNVYTSDRNWNEWGNNRSSVLSGPFGQNIYMPCADEISADLIVAQAVASLQIAEDERFDPRVFGRMLRG